MILFNFAGPFSKLLSVIAFGLSVMIAINTMIYFQDGPIPAFLLEKGDIRTNPLWITSFYFHIVSACVCLVCGAPLMVPAFLRFRRTHFVLGYIYLNAVLWIAAPTGLIISIAAKGGAWSAIGFLVTGIAWWLTTWLGYRAIVKRKIQSHIRWMVRSYSISLSAVSFRLFQIVLFSFGVDDISNYIVSVWLSFGTSVMLAEICIRSSHGFSQATKNGPFQFLYQQGAVS